MRTIFCLLFDSKKHHKTTAVFSSHSRMNTFFCKIYKGAHLDSAPSACALADFS